MANLGTTPPNPAVGTTGHFAHHTWLKDAVLAINAEMAVVRPTTATTAQPTTRNLKTATATALKADTSAAGTALKELIDILNEVGITAVTGHK